MKDLLKATYFRMILTVMALGSSALVIEAGHRWR